MIQPNELRIGNYVIWDKDNYYEYSIVVEVLSESIWIEDLDELVPIKDISPIPLTEEWLKRFGFVYWEDIDEWASPDNDATLRINHYTNGDVIGFFESMYGTEIKHVHQLQNLYFALTGEELTLKELQGEHSN